MRTSGLEEVRKRLDARFVQELEFLVLSESPSDDLAALERSAHVVARIADKYLGVPAHHEIRDGRHHLVWRLGGTTTPASGPRVLILGHYDTVWPLGTTAEFAFTQDGRVARGPGAFDMKAGLLQAFAAVELLPNVLKERVTVLVTADEEIGAPTSRPLIEREARAAGSTLVFEAAAEGGSVKTGRKGVSRYEVTVQGRAAHAGLEPWAGVNATVEAARQVLAIAALGGERPEDVSVTPTLIRAGASANTVPEIARLSVDVRSPSAAEQRRIDLALHGLGPQDPAASIEVRRDVQTAPMEVAHTEELYAELCAASSDIGVNPPARAVVGGGSDGNIAAAVGSRVLDGLGAVGGGAHSRNEHVDLDQMAPRTLLAARLMERILDSAHEGGA